ncbi:MAG: TM2 domain-containing protein [Flavobacteriales bacterium]|nr:TM2 domain-containing protein [Flavobacteriales bacterium]MCW8911690.1 TM2 domain-containing protein [Flavobacteriales bacterium]MCW8936949.1 TM2 domain-containing protein [Flavobacteriales bacterium]MCW8939279.1 TM2 domain-containing protein [Flavobacteriales bacterium]MCW8968735.1 TM2 domain-containing protein [Flavobacteriales bacterium]
MKYFLTIICFLLLVGSLFSSTIKKDSLSILNGEIITATELEMEVLDNGEVKFKRGKAILFTIFTGILGGHRIYMGTHQRTPIIYSVTFGGFGILPLIDLVHLIFTKDISVYENKTQIIMWRDN